MLPPGAVSLDEAHAAIELWEFYKRRVLDPAQRLTVEVMMATRKGGLWAAASTGREMPRQNGKGDEIEVVELWGLVQRAERILHTVHDAVLLATETHSRLLSTVEGHADLRRLKLRAWSGTGQQMIEMRNGGIVWYRTRTGGGARGVDEVDRIVVDEAQHAEDEHLAAITPTQLASVNPQLNALGTAGIAGKSRWWWRQRKRALSDDPGDFGYVGHTAERVRLEGGRLVRGQVDAADRDRWQDANPALVAGRTTLEFLDEQYRRLGPELYAREHLCVWDPEPDEEVGGNMPNWANCGDADSVIESNHQWAIATSPDRRWSTIGVAGRRADGNAHVATHYRRSGTDWVVDECVSFWESHRIPVRIWKHGPEASFIAPLVERGVKVIEVSTAEVAMATGQLRDGVEAGTVRHPVRDGGQLSSLDRAVNGAELRTSTAGAALWEQRSAVEITPLVAVTVAFGGVPLEQARPPRIYSLSKGR